MRFKEGKDSGLEGVLALKLRPSKNSRNIDFYLLA